MRFSKTKTELCQVPCTLVSNLGLREEKKTETVLCVLALGRQPAASFSPVWSGTSGYPPHWTSLGKHVAPGIAEQRSGTRSQPAGCVGTCQSTSSHMYTASYCCNLLDLFPFCLFVSCNRAAAAAAASFLYTLSHRASHHLPTALFFNFHLFLSALPATWKIQRSKIRMEGDNKKKTLLMKLWTLLKQRL